jgi:hypothetical protein
MAIKRDRKRHLSDTYSFEGFRPADEVRGIFGKPKARILSLTRRSKKQPAVNVAPCKEGGMTAGSSWYGTCRAETYTSTWNLNSGVWIAGNVAQ